MAPKELKRTPVVEVRWCKLLGEARPAYDPEKEDEWSIEIVLDNSNAEHQAWMQSVEDEYAEAHGEKKKSAHWCPIKPDKEEPRKKMSCRLKLKKFELKGRPGQFSEGPTVFDKDGNYWDHNKLIGNGSTMRLSYTIYAWGANSKTGAGISLEVRGAQVIDWLAAPEKVQNTTATDFGFESTKEADEKVLAAKADPLSKVEAPSDAASRWNVAPLVPDTDDLPF